MEKAQTKLGWKQEAWKALNTKIYDFYTKTLDSVVFSVILMVVVVAFGVPFPTSISKLVPVVIPESGRLQTLQSD